MNEDETSRVDSRSAAAEVARSQRVQSGAVPRTVVALGLVSLLMDVSSEMIHSLLPVFLVTALGATAFSLGMIEGVAEATASITRLFSGALSDWTSRRKPLLLVGYGLGALSKLLFPLARGIGLVLTARLTDRIGKGIRGAPRDALIADVTPPDGRGAAYGLRQSLDAIGAFAGPILAMLLMSASDGDIRLVFWIAVVPAFGAVGVLVVGVREPAEPPPTPRRRVPISRAELARLPAGYWGTSGAAVVLTLARFSEAFLLLRAESVGIAGALVPSVLVAMNFAYIASSYPVGRLSDQMGRRSLVMLGIVVLIAADLVLAAAGTGWLVLVGAVLWGLHMGATQGLLAAVVADAAPVDLRATAFGVFHLVTGLGLLAASILAGLLWHLRGPTLTFLAGAAFAALSCVLFAFVSGAVAENDNPTTTVSRRPPLAR